MAETGEEGGNGQRRKERGGTEGRLTQAAATTEIVSVEERAQTLLYSRCLFKMACHFSHYGNLFF